MNLYYRKIGQGKPFVFLHGLLGSSDTFYNAALALSDRYTVFIPDLRNHGRSPHHPEMNYNAMCSDLLHFFEEHHIEKPIVAGHSMGGKLAMVLALKMPDIPARLIVVDIALRAYPVHYIKVLMPALDIDFNTMKSRSDIRHFLIGKISDFRIVDLLIKNIERKENNTLGWRSNFEVLYNSTAHFLDEVNLPGLYKSPTLIISGEKSDYVNNNDIIELRNKFPDLQQRIIPGSGHWVHSDNQQSFLKALNEFLVSEK